MNPQATLQIADDGTTIIQVTDWLEPVVSANLVNASITGTTAVVGSQIVFTIVVSPKVKFGAKPDASPVS